MSLYMFECQLKYFHYQHSEIFAVGRTHLDGCQRTTDLRRWQLASWVIPPRTLLIVTEWCGGCWEHMLLDYISTYATDNGGPLFSSHPSPITKRRIDLNLYQSFFFSSDRLWGPPGFLPSRSAGERLGDRSPPSRAEFRLHGAIPLRPALTSAKCT